MERETDVTTPPQVLVEDTGNEKIEKKPPKNETATDVKAALIEKKRADLKARADALLALKEEQPVEPEEEEGEEAGEKSDQQNESSDRRYLIPGTQSAVSLSTREMLRFTNHTLKKGHGFIGDDEQRQRPRERAQCVNGARPCPWVSCKHHLLLDVDPETGSLKINFPDALLNKRGLSIMAETCSLDVAEQGGLTLEDVGDLLNLTRERIRQIEEASQRALRAGVPDSGASDNDLFDRFDDLVMLGANGTPLESQELSQMRRTEWGSENSVAASLSQHDSRDEESSGNPPGEKLQRKEDGIDFTLGGRFK